jgi:transcription elongation factor GreB
MSKAFTREDDLVEPPADPPVPRVPPGETRYVTPEGFRALQRELDLLDPSSRRAKIVAATLPLLTMHAPRCEGRVVFGCWVVLRDESGSEASWRIVGPDEADARERRLSVASPLARELLGKQAGESVSIELPRGAAAFEVVAVGASDPAAGTAVCSTE